MNELETAGPQGPADAAGRVAEITRLFNSIRQLLDHAIGEIGVTTGSQSPKAIVAKLNELHSAHLKVLAAEEAFHAEQAPNDAIEDADFEAIRVEIGRQLDRLRAAIIADKLPVDADPCAACRAALSI